MGTSAIEWTEKTWNPVTGCTPVSEGCAHCYAKRRAETRFRGRFGYPADEPFRPGTVHANKMEEPLHWRKPARVFVCSMGDLFHDDVPQDAIDDVFGVMGACPQHTFQVLTKRPERMREYVLNVPRFDNVDEAIARARRWEGRYPIPTEGDWPLSNVWLGVTAENQQAADERIPYLLNTPAAVRFVSVEPMLGPVDLTEIGGVGHTTPDGICRPILRHDSLRGREHCGDAFFSYQPNRLNWVICGGESGPGARPMRSVWARDLRDQCSEAGVPFFFKSWGDWFPRDQWEDNPETILPDDDFAYNNTASPHLIRFEERGTHGRRIDVDVYHRIGKQKAGRLLDGALHDAYPKARD